MELGAKEYILIKSFDGTNCPTDLVKQVKDSQSVFKLIAVPIVAIRRMSFF